MLTEVEKEKIKLMREFGMKYDEIANRLGISVNRVRYYCKQEGYLLKVDDMPTKRCRYCRKKLTADRYVPNKKFCNRSCREIYLIKKRERKSNDWIWCKCNYCGKYFEGWDDRQFCSRECSNLSRKRIVVEEKKCSTLIRPSSDWMIKYVKNVIKEIE